MGLLKQGFYRAGGRFLPSRRPTCRYFRRCAINVVGDLWWTRHPHRWFVLDQQRQRSQAKGDAAEPKKSYLTVAHREDLLKSRPPPFGRHERQKTFDDKHDSHCLPEAFAAHGTLTLNSSYRRGGVAGAVLPAAPPPEPRMALKKSDDGSSTITSDFLLKLAL